MLRRVILSALLTIVAFAIAVPSASAVPSWDDSAYPGGWPEIQAVWLAGPPPVDSTTTTTQPGTMSVNALSSPTADMCSDVLPDPQIDLVKAADRTQLTPTQMRLRVQLDTTSPAGEYRMRDCIWIDLNSNGVWDEATETLFGFDTEPIVFVADPSDNIGSFARFRVNLPVASNQPVCDRATRSDQIDTPPPSPGPLLRSNTLCLPGDPDPVVPEFNLAVVLPLTGILLAAVVWFTRRRHNAITA